MKKVIKQNYRTLFGGETLTGQGTDPEMMDILQLTTLEAESQLHSYYHGNINAGNSPETLTAVVIQCLPYIGFPAAIKALRIIRQEYAK